MPTYANITGRITIPGTEVAAGGRLEVTATPMTANNVVVDTDRANWGPATAETDDSGSLTADPLRIPLGVQPVGVLWRITARPLDKRSHLGTMVIGVFEITASTTIQALLKEGGVALEAINATFREDITGYADSAQAAATSAAASATTAAQIAGLTDADAAFEMLVNDPTSDTATALSASFAGLEYGRVRPDQLPPLVQEAFVYTTTKTRNHIGVSTDVNANGECFIHRAPAAATGKLGKGYLWVRSIPSTGKTSVQVRVTAGTLTGHTVGGTYTITKATGVITVPISGPGLYEFDTANLAVSQGEYIALQVEAGVSIGYGSAAASGAGFDYVYQLATPFAPGVGGTYSVMQVFTDRAYGFGFDFLTQGTGLAASQADVDALRVAVDASNLTVPIVEQEVHNWANLNSNTAANGECIILREAVSEPGTISAAYLWVRSIPSAGKTSVQVRVTAGTLPGYTEGATYTVRAASAIINVPIASPGLYEFNPNLAVVPGDYVALQIEAGVNVGYSSAANTGVGFGYVQALANPFSAAPGGTYSPMQAAFPTHGCGFGFDVTNPGSAVGKIQTDVQQLRADLDNVAVMPNPLFGKKVVAMGDSMVQGHSLATSQVWLAKIAARNGMTSVNYGINGTHLANVDYAGQKGAVIRYTSMVDDADYVLIFAGTNDAQAGTPLGAATSTTTTEFNGALNVLLSGLITKYPTKKIGFITPYRRNANYPAYVDAIKARCAEHGIAVFDNVANGGVDWGNTAQVAALTLGDTYHLNEAGMTHVSTKYEAFLRAL